MRQQFLDNLKRPGGSRSTQEVIEASSPAPRTIRNADLCSGSSPEVPVERVELSSVAPLLLVIVDAEEEFDWDYIPPLASSVQSMRRQEPAQCIFKRFGVVPTYAVDYEVASRPEGYGPLLEFLADRSCEIGAQLHPWVNPPIIEELTLLNSFPGNLPPELEFSKMRELTCTIEQNLNRRPLLYRAGRYGIGPHTAAALEALGYQVDCSVRPFYTYHADGGPSFLEASTDLHWLTPVRRILEIPVTVGMTGLIARFGRRFYPWVSAPAGRLLHIPGILARTGLLNRVQLSPEGSSLAEAKSVTRAMLKRDCQQVFVVSYHSPSLQPGNTPYVRSDRDLKVFLHWIEAYLDFFLNEIKGIASTPAALFRLADASSDPQRHRSREIQA